MTMRAILLSPILRATSILLLCVFTLYGCTTTNTGDNPSGANARLQNTAQPTQKANINIPLRCEKNVLTPALFRTVNRRLRTFEGSPDYQNIPATIEWTDKRIQIAPARFPQETVPATYREITEEITTLKSRVEVIGKPATYKTINKPVTIRQAHTGWKEGCAASDPMQCIVTIPAEREVIRQQFIDFPARVLQVEKPAKTITVTRKELVTPGQGTGTPIPAKYKTVKVGRISKVWQIIATPRPDRFTEIPVQVKIRPERVRLMPAVCYEPNATPHMRAIQQRLQQLGYPVEITGIANQRMLKALTQFQQDNKLAMGAITLETLRKLALYP